MKETRVQAHHDPGDSEARILLDDIDEEDLDAWWIPDIAKEDINVRFTQHLLIAFLMARSMQFLSFSRNYVVRLRV